VSASVQAQVQIDITRGRVEPMPIAVANFPGNDEASVRVGRDLSSVISNDLERSGLFRPVDRDAFIQALPSLDVQPRFSDWRALSAQGLIQGEIETQENGQMRVAFRLWDVYGGQQMIGQAYVTQPENWRRVAHIIADAIYTQITGETGYFDTRVVYVAESGPGTARIKRLAIMDQDGAGHRFLTDGSALVLTPRFSPDGNKVTFSMAADGNSEIYEMDLRTRRTLRLTNHPAIDTSASYAPDGRQLTFNSDRGGSQQIYVMNSDGSEARRISFSGGRYATPVWSPRGDLIAFTRISSGTFYIGVMQPDGKNERLLAQGFLVESPTWSPNGRVLMYFAQEARRADGSGGRTKLYSIDLTGYNQREIVTPQDGSDPAWSPLIP
jgi:TolB protein